MKAHVEKIKLPAQVIVTDPGYSEKIWCNELIDNVLPGNYIVRLVMEHDGCVKCLRMTHEDYASPRHRFLSMCGVDTGTMGIFDAKKFFKYAKNDEWYSRNVVSWAGEKLYHLLSWGGMSCSGYGDGMYPLSVAKNRKGQVISFKIQFIS